MVCDLNSEIFNAFLCNFIKCDRWNQWILRILWSEWANGGKNLIFFQKSLKFGSFTPKITKNSRNNSFYDYKLNEQSKEKCSFDRLTLKIFTFINTIMLNRSNTIQYCRYVLHRIKSPSLKSFFLLFQHSTFNFIIK